METSPAWRRLAPAMAVACTAVALVGASGAYSAKPTETIQITPAAERAVVTLKPGTVRARDIASRQIQPRHLGLRTMSRVIGSGPASRRPRATRATAGWLYFADDIDGGALFRSTGRTWEQLTTGRLGRIARNSLDSSRIKPRGISGSRLADDSVTARSMSMDAWRAISTSGPLAARPAPGDRPAGSLFFATDVQGGTLYQNSGGTWLTISSASLASNTIGSAELAPNAVGAAQLAAGAVGSTQLADGSVKLADIDPAVWSNRIAAGTLAARPAAASSNANSLYFATDDAGGTMSRSNGSSWQVVGRTRNPRSISMYVGTWTNQPAALTEMIGNNRARIRTDLEAATQARLSVNVAVAGNNASTGMCVQYSTDNGASWSNFDGSSGATACASGVVHTLIRPAGFYEAAWQTIPADARVDDALLRIVGENGNGGTDPQLGIVTFEVR